MHIFLGDNVELLGIAHESRRNLQVEVSKNGRLRQVVLRQSRETSYYSFIFKSKVNGLK